LFEPGVNRRVSLIVHQGDRDHLIPGTNISMDDLHRYQLVGRRLQARAMAGAFVSLFRLVRAALKSVATGIRQASRQAAATRELAAMDDHLLADIGIRRQDIPAAVAGLLSRESVAPESVAEPVAQLAPGPTPACNQPHGKAAA
jgi:uncharacterized protein YjiS (DUF1127 family)